MMQCLPAQCRLLSPVSTHVTQRPYTATKSISQIRRASGLVVRAESASASTSTTTVEAASTEVAVPPPAPASKSIITEENIINAIAGDNIILEDHYGRLLVDPEASSSEKSFGNGSWSYAIDYGVGEAYSSMLFQLGRNSTGMGDLYG